MQIAIQAKYARFLLDLGRQSEDEESEFVRVGGSFAPAGLDEGECDCPECTPELKFGFRYAG